MDAQTLLPWVVFGLYALVTEVRLARLRSRLRKYEAVAVLLFLSPETIRAQDKVDFETPTGQLVLVLTDLTVNVKPEDAPFVRYVSFFNVKKMFGSAGLAEFRDRAFPYEFNRHSAARNPVPLIPVDGPNGTVARTPDCTLVRVDIRRGLWTRTAWVLVADRDYLFREAPLGPLPHRETQYGRLLTGIRQNPKTLSAGFIVNGWQLFRDAMGLVKSDTGHDLLYANERHPDADKGIVEFAAVGGGETPVAEPFPEREPPLPKKYVYRANSGPWLDGRVYPHDFEYVRETKEEVDAIMAAREAWRKAKAAWREAHAGKPAKGVPFLPARPVSVDDANKGIKGFPLTLKQFQTRWGVRRREDRLKEFLFDSAVGGIALAADSDPDRGSFVAAGGDRVVRIEPSEFGIAKTTFDSKVPKDDQDQIERDQFFQITQGVIKKDGGEAFCTIPNGADAEFLFNANEESVTKADPELAKHLEPKLKDPRFPDVQIGYCGACHAESAGYIPFVEQFTDLRSKGIKFNVPSGKEQEVDDFYKGWQKQVKRYRFPYQTYIEDLTAGADGKPLAPVKVWPLLMDWRDAYDKPVKIKVLAADFGMSVDAARQLIMQPHEPEGPPQTRLNQLAIDGYVPRRTYEANVYRDFALWADLKAPRKEKARELVTPQVVEDAIKRFVNHPEKK